jgi:rubredoxin
MADIPGFSFDESQEIAGLLDEAGIPYERTGAVTSASRYGGGVAFTLSVPDGQLAEAVQVIKSYYGFLDAPPEAVTGNCPACGAVVNNAFECPDCGLSLSFDPRALMKRHPFTAFLEKLEKAGMPAN